ncbi:hypothetical protein [Lysinibacillus varians]|uniref:Uncharacterized protein n=1 Tax=Lysinibacillus varians TaxID=1145276 RepID=A0ABY2TDE2_9BACI|nr:hypothetical protein [Lysinibacillus varians]AHN24321.1 hypothetical protein T479_14440 [Lysinibacillus varians]TKI65050.1 hypothetical protein FC752_09755 [Lysinibacillus varians]
MKIRFDLEDDVSVLQNKNVHADFYLDSYLEVFVLENNQKTLLFSTTIHSTIIITFSRQLIELYQTGKKLILDTFGNANVYTFKKVGNNLIITNFSVYSNSEEWEYTYDFKAFLKAYTKGLRIHLQNLIIKDAKIVKRPDFILLKEGLKSLEEVIFGK